ncbi:MFS transporter [Paraburkholderia antibiotica]|uniref:MFS transporter n=1 Tax=Paraburkholderia antibiotica TaxID=2728839 RepID=A0A7X9ZXT6_9BURK|nr:MFS transporter [Paraburkholderia antibiotica]NML30668.1 MFS transporter [Paraburkholderia antibiotica]
MSSSPLSAARGAALAEGALHSASRKNLLRLVPLLAIGYFFNYIDRTNIGFAALTMNHDLGLTNTQFGAAAGMFFIGYCLLEVPSNLALYRFGARRWLARIMISWGLLASACAFVGGPTSFYVLRILTGAAEAGFFPGVLFYLSCWFPARNRVKILAWFLVAIPLSSVVGGPMSVAIMTMDGIMGLRGWQWLFLLEGLPACVLGVLTLLLLRDRPQEANWLTDNERSALIDALDEERASIPQKNFGAALRDPKVWIMTGILFSYWIGINGIAIWLPLILKGHGLTNTLVGFLSGLPYLIAAVVMIVWARWMDRSGRHVLHLVGACLVAAVGLGFSVMFDALTPAMIGIVLAVIGLSSARPAFYSLPSRYLSGVAAAGGMAFINATGSLGGYVGPWMVGVLKDTTHSFFAGMVAMSAMLVVAAVLSLVLIAVTKET